VNACRAHAVRKIADEPRAVVRDGCNRKTLHRLLGRN
jgi:hypothetical protein